MLPKQTLRRIKFLIALEIKEIKLKLTQRYCIALLRVTNLHI